MNVFQGSTETLSALNLQNRPNEAPVAQSVFAGPTTINPELLRRFVASEAQGAVTSEGHEAAMTLRSIAVDHSSVVQEERRVNEFGRHREEQDDAADTGLGLQARCEIWTN